MTPPAKFERTDARATTYTVNLDAPMHEWITVVLTCVASGGPHKPPHDTWAIRKGGWVLPRDEDTWEYEPIPSSRDAEFYARCRYTLDEALNRANEIARREAIWRIDAR
jgi:hypothetical protein